MPGQDFVCDACGLSFAGSTFLLRHKSVRCQRTSADQPSSAEDHEAQADEPMESSDQEKATEEDATLPCDAESSYIVVPTGAISNENSEAVKENTQASSSRDQEVQAEPRESLDTATANEEDAALVFDAESSYVVVHIGTTGSENSRTVVEENSSFCVVHVQPAPSSEESNTKRLRKGKQGTTPVVNGNTRKVANTRKRSVESVGTAKQTLSKSASSKARKTPSTNGTKAPKKSMSSKTATAGTKRKTASGADGSIPQVKKRKVTQPIESRGRKKAKKSERSSTKGKASSSSEDVEDESVEEYSAETASPKSRKKSKKSNNFKSSSPGKEEDTAAAAEDERAEKRPHKKKPRKTRKSRDKESKEDPTDPSKMLSPTKRKKTAPEDKPIFTCEQCLRRFKWKSSFDYHMRSHTAEKEFKCTFCNKGLSQLSSLKRHLRVHSGEKPYECEECGQRFVEKGKLTVHLRKHTGEPLEKKYKCSVCDRGFTLSANLRTHMRTHTGEKPYPCPQCGKGFKRSSDIVSHLRSHTGERPYKCSHCTKSFTMISHRNRHEVIHTGNKPFRCDLCGKGFTQPNSVKAHLKVHARKRARLEGRDPGQEQQERTCRDEEMQTDGQHGVAELRQGVPQSSGSEQLQMSSTQRNGMQETGVAEGEGDRTKELEGVITQLMETERLQMDSVQEGSSHTQNHQNDGAELLHVQSDSTQALQPEHLHVDSSGVDGLEEQEISSGDETGLRTIATEQLQLSCTTTDSTSDQLNIDNTLINGKELLQLGSAAQSDGAGHQPVELAPSNVQEQVQLAEGNETTLLAL